MKYPVLFFLSLAVSGCAEEAIRSDAYGNFEATTTTIGAEASGRLLQFNLAEGQELRPGQIVGLVDTTQLHLQRQQLEAQLGTFGSQVRSPDADIAVYEDQKSNLIRERDRTKRLVDAKAATPKQLDELNGQIEVINQQIVAARSRTNEANRGLLAGRAPVRAQLDLVAEQIAKAYVRNPVRGTVLTKLAEADEIVGIGSPLYRIADMDTLTLRAYAGSVQLQRARLGQRVTVLIDAGETGYDTLPGTISWISERAEFTPKTIQTKEERTNLVYALKVAVANPDGRLKLGMPAEVNFGGADAGAGEKQRSNERN
ncbi:HlyD family efflux transporter periplasmic adaptor subunit [Neolewinella lacunae]|uniref:HlyD family efflux transporter periplasmic adaptor subunit n=1 Tax=Neolewinella lacunae TaxID=1517758 RepID=A0A923PJ50_9BACT|nr:HlyD family efflux transporter periplasmic adaptor subunit [Neolewinella lacunae]MBC6995093.1 HlyD family efflux transporter periplasmic adaptor subunit [Neolewinella lacunae]MDN3634043.1 HlyD family efflux transporter periplasmic adaptor subunit [Neolewinella lacunae]